MEPLINPRTLKREVFQSSAFMTKPSERFAFQVQHYTGDQTGSKVTSTWMGLKRVYLQGGFRALFAGLSINYLKVVPSTAIGFTVYDSAKQYLGLPQNL